MDQFLTNTGTHKNNPTGAATPTTVASGIAISPLWPLSTMPVQDYPIEKLALLRELFTKYTAFQPGDYLTVGATTYAVKSVLPWESAGSLDTYYQLVVELQLGG